MGRALRVEPEQASAIIRCLKKDRDDIEGYYVEMGNIAESLVESGYMEGDAAEKYVEEFRMRIEPDLEAALAIIDECIAELEKIVDEFIAVEQAAFASVFGT